MPPPPPVSSASRFCRKLRFEPPTAPSRLASGEVVPSNKQQKMKTPTKDTKPKATTKLTNRRDEKRVTRGTNISRGRREGGEEVDETC